MATYMHPVTGEKFGYVPYEELSVFEKGLVDSDNLFVRAHAAYQRLGLDRLMTDGADVVRESVAKQGFGLDALVCDRDWMVRCAVAHQGYGLERLIHDEDPRVRAAVAWMGHGLECLVRDEDPRVRATVANQGYDLDILASDPDENVRENVGAFLKSLGMTLGEWADARPDEGVTSLRDRRYAITFTAGEILDCLGRAYEPATLETIDVIAEAMLARFDEGFRRTVRDIDDAISLEVVDGLAQ